MIYFTDGQISLNYRHLYRISDTISDKKFRSWVIRYIRGLLFFDVESRFSGSRLSIKSLIYRWCVNGTMMDYLGNEWGTQREKWCYAWVGICKLGRLLCVERRELTSSDRLDKNMQPSLFQPIANQDRSHGGLQTSAASNRNAESFTNNIHFDKAAGEFVPRSTIRYFFDEPPHYPHCTKAIQTLPWTSIDMSLVFSSPLCKRWCWHDLNFGFRLRQRQKMNKILIMKNYIFWGK